ALDAGAHGITVHPRPDQRHVRPHDVTELAALLDEPAYRKNDYEFNIEGNPFEGHYVQLVAAARPTQCTLVPDDPDQSTSDHGWNVAENLTRLKAVVGDLKAAGCRVSLFMDADPRQIELVPETGADRVELYTEPYAKAFTAGGEALQKSLADFQAAAEQAHAMGLGVNAGHDLNLENLPRFAAEVPYVEEVSIGHALTAEALERGMKATVEAYLAILS
ncbi:MAG: pyridoxine 5'-phosphate synthase, partial [Phycisphaeraceae bacterium]